MEGEKIRFPFLVLQIEKEGRLQCRVEGGACKGLEVRRPRAEGSQGHFDLDCLLEYNRCLSRMAE